ncbi:MAG: hypothetical protein IJS01_10315 [Lentisphaeria bacterium]|nr:hypothetical protein [Lentisphaeria bacterium]
MKIKGLRIASVKRTVLGRTFCRLLGDEMGAVAMEYVVIALLVVAASVGAALFFGAGIRRGLVSTVRMIFAPNKTAESQQISSENPGFVQAGQAQSNAVKNNIGGTDTPE